MSAPPSAKDQVARLLTLVPYLHAHGEVRLDEAAQALGVDPDQLFGDLKVLFMCGLPGGYPDDLIDVDIDALEGPDGVRTDGVIKVSNADYLARPLRLNPTEASAVIVALRALRNGAKDDTREVVDRALAKLEAAAAQGSARGSAAAQIDPGDGAADTDLALLASQLQGAADRGRQVRLSYYVPSRDEQSERVVDPRGVVTADGQPLPRRLVPQRRGAAAVPAGPDRPGRGARRAGRDAPGGAARPRATASSASRPTSRPVTLLLEPEARWMTSYYPVEEIREVGQDRMEVVLLVADERWLTRLMLRLAPHAAWSCRPPAYADTFMAAARRALSLYALTGEYAGDALHRPCEDLMTPLAHRRARHPRAAPHPGCPRPALRRRQAARAGPGQRPGAADLQGRDQGPDGRRRGRRRLLDASIRHPEPGTARARGQAARPRERARPSSTPRPSGSTAATPPDPADAAPLIKRLAGLLKGSPHHPVGPDGRMALSDHLRELRARIIRSTLVVIVAFFVALYFYQDLYQLILHPYEEAKKQLPKGTESEAVLNGVAAGLTFQLKLCGLAALVGSSPYWLYQIWAFIVPGLHPSERKWSRIFAAIAGPLFFAGRGGGLLRPAQGHHGPDRVHPGRRDQPGRVHRSSSPSSAGCC